MIQEELYRGKIDPATLDKTIVLCGAGSVGANLTLHLAQVGFRMLRVLDFDSIEPHNRVNQPWGRADVGLPKWKALSNLVYRQTDISIDAQNVKINRDNIHKYLVSADLVIDGFDNFKSRTAVMEACTNLFIPCLHVGMLGGYGEGTWNEVYRPIEADIIGCDYPLAHNLVTLTIGAAGEVIYEFLSTGNKANFAITLSDLTITKTKILLSS